MTRLIKVLLTVLILSILVFFHVGYVNYCRGCFSIGSEWFVYGIITYVSLCWAGGLYEKIQSKK